MIPLQEHLDDLQRMVDNGIAPKHEVMGLIAFIAREVAALQEAYARAIDGNAKLKDELAKLQDAQARAVARQNEALHQEALRAQQIMADPTFEPDD